MLANNILWAILLFFIQPIFLVGLLYTLFNRNKRVKYSRKQFRVNFNRTNFELKDFFLVGLLPGIILSVLSLGLGIPLTIEWYLIYQVVAILLLLIGGSRFIHPLFTFSTTSLVIAGLNALDLHFEFQWLQDIMNDRPFHLSGPVDDVLSVRTNVLLFTSLLLLISLFTLNRNTENKIFPVLRSSQRGKMVAQYPHKSLWLLPMAVIVPGEVIEPFAEWWPLFPIGSESYALLLLPILGGFHYTVSTQLLSEATSQLQKEFLWVSLAGFLGFGFSYFYPDLSIWVVGILLLLGLIVLYRHRRRENMHNYRYGPAEDGVRVIAVRPNSPAERMNLSIGDVIMNMNDQAMTTREQFSEIVAYNRSYVKMRIKRKDGEIVIAETPLYDDDFNNLGLLILDN